MGLFGPPNVQKLRAQKDVKGLIKALAYPKDWHICKAAAEALGQIGDSRAVEPLTTALGDEDRFVREIAEEAVHRIASEGGSDACA